VRIAKVHAESLLARAAADERVCETIRVAVFLLPDRLRRGRQLVPLGGQIVLALAEKGERAEL